MGLPSVCWPGRPQVQGFNIDLFEHQRFNDGTGDCGLRASREPTSGTRDGRMWSFIGARKGRSAFSTTRTFARPGCSRAVLNSLLEPHPNGMFVLSDNLDSSCENHKDEHKGLSVLADSAPFSNSYLL